MRETEQKHRHYLSIDETGRWSLIIYDSLPMCAPTAEGNARALWIRFRESNRHLELPEVPPVWDGAYGAFR
ncbi:MAG: hypothetical protein LAP85_21915 [Acidobacteriia bacterium]|nr:hypothetical protein [Terriglobia bacterium]